MSAAILYTIQPVDPSAHLFRISCTVCEPDPQGQSFRLPAWIPGSYMIRDFAKNIVELWAESDGQIVACEKTDKSTWRCEPVQSSLTVTCDVYAWDLSVRAAHLDDTHGYFNGTSVFLAVLGQESSACSVTILPPEGDAFSDWRVATTLPPAAGNRPWSFGEYLAKDYGELIDHPVEMGRFVSARFEACGVPHDVVLTGIHRADIDRLCSDLKKICEAQIRFFGEPAPMNRYLFLIMVVGEGYGGLEHRSSTSLLVSREDLPLVSDDSSVVTESYRGFLGLCSHEYFHTWNVKRIKPDVFLPCELLTEVHTRQLWFFEGFTSYYDDLFLVRTGLITPESYLELLARNITRVLRVPGRHKQSVAESSFDAWTKYYRQDENAPNAIVSYYAKGAMVALALDLEMRIRTDGKKTLDDVMGLLWQRHGQTGVGVHEDGVEQIVRELLGSELDGFFSRYVYGVDDLPLEALFAGFGIEWHLRAAESQSDAGGKPARSDRPRASLGVRTQADAAGVRIQHCYEQAACARAGLSAGDTLVAINGLKVTQANLEKMLSGFRAREMVRVHAFRRDELREVQVTLDAAPADTCWLAFGKGRLVPAARRWLQVQGDAP